MIKSLFRRKKKGKRVMTEKEILTIHYKLNLLWLLLNDIAVIEGFPKRYTDILDKEWEKLRQKEK